MPGRFLPVLRQDRARVFESATRIFLTMLPLNIEGLEIALFDKKATISQKRITRSNLFRIEKGPCSQKNVQSFQNKMI
jgi:hypothetical protein